MQSPAYASIFAFYNDFWVNFHHFLCEQVGIGAFAAKPAIAEPAIPAGTPDQQAAWTALLDYYQQLPAHDGMFSPDLVMIKECLVTLTAQLTIQQAGLPPLLADLLATTAPLYQQQWWPEHQRLNSSWIEHILPHVARLGQTIMSQIVATFQTQEPLVPTRVDLTNYAGWAGAYTADNPPFPSHLTIASSDARNQGWLAVEIVFHEAAHTLVHPFEGFLGEGIARARAQVAQPGPRDLWHCVLFYSVGVIVRRSLAEHGVANYVPYADHFTTVQKICSGVMR